MATHDRSCPSCGARVSSDADRCDLCGTAVEPPGDEETEDPPEGEHSLDTDSEESSSPQESDDTQPVYCNQCGWENPPDANYCSQCGEKLQDLADQRPSGTRPVAADLPSGGSQNSEADPSSSRPTSEQEGMGRQIVLVVGGAGVLVLALFFVTQWSEGYDWSQESKNESPAAQTPAGSEGPSAGSGSSSRRMPGTSSGGGTDASAGLQELVEQASDTLSGPMAGQVDSLRGRIKEAPSGEKQQLRAELVNLLIGAGQPGRAAVQQKKVAEATGAVDDRRRTADLLYRWMQKLQNQGQRKHVFEVARHAAETYAAVVEERPDDLDARTRMGEAYLLTNEPMKGIKTINAVLNDDSTFVPARFQKGLALLQINRIDQARKEFEKVLRDAEEQSPFYRQAERAIQVIDKRNKTSGQSSSGSTGR